MAMVIGGGRFEVQRLAICVDRRWERSCPAADPGDQRGRGPRMPSKSNPTLEALNFVDHASLAQRLFGTKPVRFVRARGKCVPGCSGA